MSNIHSLVRQGNKEGLLNELNNKNIDINEKNGAGLTPLHLAVMKGHLAIVDILLNYQADIYALDQFGNTPFYLAIVTACDQENLMQEAKYFEILKLFLINEARIRNQDNKYRDYVLLKDRKNTNTLAPMVYLKRHNSSLYEKINTLIENLESNPTQYGIQSDYDNQRSEPKEIKVSQKASFTDGSSVRNRKKHLPPVKSTSLSSDEEDHNLKIYHSPPAKSTFFESSKKKKVVALDMQFEKRPLLK